MDKHETKMNIEQTINSLQNDLKQCDTVIEQAQNKKISILLEVAKQQGKLEMLEEFDSIEG